MIPQEATERWFDLNGTLLRVSADNADLIAPLLPYLGELGVPPETCAAAFDLAIARGTLEPIPSDARLLYEGFLPEGISCQIGLDASGWRWLAVPNRLSLGISIGGRRSRMRVVPGSEALIASSATVFALDAALKAGGQIMIHAAALSLPGREAAIALLAPSGAGKTTTSLALALQGFALMTDDAAVLIPSEAGSGAPPGIWGLPRPLKVHRRTAEMLPRIHGLLCEDWNDEDEQAMARDTLQPVASVALPRPVALAAFVMLGPRVTGEHRLQPVSKADLLAAIAADNIFCSRQGVLGDDLDRYSDIARTIMELPALELNVGSQLESLGEALVAAFG